MSYDRRTASRPAAPEIDWAKVAQKLLRESTRLWGRDDEFHLSQEGFNYRAYMRAIIQGQPAQATHMVKTTKGGLAARAALIDAGGM